MKIDAARGYGATIDTEAPDIPSAFERLDELVESTGRTLVHPYDDPLVMAGQGTVALEMLAAQPEIDTLVVAITDMQGRLMGKRVQAQAFLNGVIDHGAHFCTYLLGTDMEMNTPEGFALMNWETGYGDWIAEAGIDGYRLDTVPA